MSALERIIMLEAERERLYKDATLPLERRTARIAGITEKLRDAQDAYNRERALKGDPTNGIPSRCFTGGGVPTTGKPRRRMV